MGAAFVLSPLCGARKFIPSSQSAQMVIDIFVKYAEIYFARREILRLILTNPGFCGIL